MGVMQSTSHGSRTRDTKLSLPAPWVGIQHLKNVLGTLGRLGDTSSRINVPAGHTPHTHWLHPQIPNIAASLAVNFGAHCTDGF